MKKAFFLAAVLLIGITAFADPWSNYLGVSWKLPTRQTITVDDDDEDANVKFKDITGLSIYYAGVYRKGFAVKGQLGINYSKSNIFNDLYAINTECIFGAGYAPIRSDHILLAVFGTIGGTIFQTEKKHDMFFKFSIPTVGLNITSIYTFSGCFSIHGSMGVGCLLSGEMEATCDDERISKKWDTKPSVYFTPEIGITFKF